ncbi:undecaprenyldiphospho-muramoylpentapeptide beta-N-acetylglucosaminyltransferase [Patescibacteria group bacterium]
MRVLFTGGGTGGHITPIIAVAKELKKNYPHELEMYFIGAKGPYGFSNILEKEGIKTKFIISGKFRRYFSIKLFSDLFKIPIGFCQSLWNVFALMPDVIFSKGGYGSLPIVIAGWIYRIPIITHESDTIPGIATRLGGKFSKRIAVSFSKAEDFFPPEKTALIGLPIRSEIFESCQSARQEDRELAKNVFGISSQKPVILAIGGSQGSQQIDQIILEILPQLFGKYEVIHQCSSKEYNNIKKETDSIENYYLFPFLNENQLKSAFILADVIISRAGATSIFEIAACGKPSILIPLPNSAFNHQRENAFAYAKTGAAIVIEQVNLTPNILLNEISKIINDSDLAKRIGDNAKNFAIIEAGQKIAEEIIKLAI